LLFFQIQKLLTFDNFSLRTSIDFKDRSSNHFSIVMEFTAEQKTWCIVWYGTSGSPTDVLRKYRTRFGRRAVTPNRRSIENWWGKLVQTGSLNRKKKRRQGEKTSNLNNAMFAGSVFLTGG
jgi:hypothetical protein